MEPAPDHELPMAKLFVSPLPPTQLSRPQLIQKMNEATAYKLTLLCAPAGYGKTTLLCAWAAQATHPVIWLSLNEAENDPPYASGPIS